MKSSDIGGGSMSDHIRSDKQNNKKTTDEEITSEIEKIVQIEKKILSSIDENIANISSEEAKILEHLGDYTEEPFDIIESYFDGKHLERLVRHQIEGLSNQLT